MPIKPIKVRLYKGPIDPTLTLFVDARYLNSFPNDNTGNLNNLATNQINSGGGTLVGNLPYSTEENGCFIFSSNKYIDFLSNTIVYNNTEDFTLSAYVKPEQDQSNIPFAFGNTIFSSPGSDNSNFIIGYGLRSFGVTAPQKFFFNCGNAYVYTSKLYPENNWYHVTFTREKIGPITYQYKIYVDGKLEETATGGAQNLTVTNMRIGQGINAVGGNFNGKMSMVKLWKRALSNTEVLLDYVSSQVKPYTLGAKSTKSDIILYLNEKGTNTGWGDSSIYSNGAGLVGNVSFNNGLVGSGTLNSYAEGTLSQSPGQNFTISVLFEIYGAGSNPVGQNLFISSNSSLGAAPTPSGFGLIYMSTKNILFAWANNANILSTPNQINYNQKTQVTATYNGTTFKIYINGVLQNSNAPSPTVTFNFTNRTYNVGYWRYQDIPGDTTYARPINGKIYNVVLYNRTLNDTEVNNLYVSLPSVYKSSESTYNQTAQSSKVFWIDAGEPKSYYLTGNTASDLSIYGRQGTFSTDYNGSLPTFGQYNGGYFHFAGSKSASIGNSFISFSDTGLPSSNQPSTVIAWARTEDAQKNQTIFVYGSDITNGSRLIGINGGNYASFVDRYTGITSPGVESNKWFQISQSFDGTKNYLYVNGVLVNSENRVPATFLSKARLGAGFYIFNSTIIDQYFKGDIGEVTIYNRFLDPQEIYQDYKVKRHRYGLGDVDRPIDTSQPTLATVITDSVSSTTTSAQVNSTITFDGNSNITQKGVIWSTNVSPLDTSLSTKTNDGSGNSSFTSNLTSLSPGIGYYVRSYVINSQGTSYGNTLSFNTTSIITPTVIAITASYTGTTADATGNVTDLGGDPTVDAIGFIWNTSTIPTNTVVATYPRIVFNTGSYGTGQFTIQITGLSSNTIYFVRAFATNSAGTKLSNEELVFRTYAFATVTVGTINTITDTDAIVPITTSGQLISAQGAVWRTDTAIPNISNDPNTEIILTPPNSGSSNSTNISVLIAGTTYYVWGWVQNIAGITYSSTYKTITTDNIPSVTTNPVTNILDTTATFNGVQNLTNGSPVTQRGFVWTDSIENDLTVDSYLGKTYSLLTNGFVNEGFTKNIDGLLPLSYYIVKAYAINSVGVGYGSGIPFTTYGNADVRTDSSQPDAINPSTTQFLYGTLLSLGGDNSVEVGFYWGTTNNPTTKVTVNDTQTSAGQIGLKLTGLTAGTTYYFRAYVINILGETKGTVLSFTTSAISSISAFAFNPGVDATTQIITSTSSNDRTALITFDITVANADGYTRGVEYGTYSNFATFSTQDVSIISGQSTQTLTVYGRGDFGETWYYKGFIRSADNLTKITSNNTLTWQFEDIRLDSIIYSSATDQFTVTVTFNNTSGRTVSIGIAHKNAANADPYTDGLAGFTFRTIVGNIINSGVYSTNINANTYLSGDWISGRAYVLPPTGRRIFSVSTKQAQKTAVLPLPTITLSTLPTNGVNIGGDYILGLYSEITSTGGQTVTSQGIIYSQTTTNNNPLIGGSGVTRLNFSSTLGTTPFFMDIPSGLIYNTQYTIKSFVITSAGTGYSTSQTVTTNSIQLRITTNTTELGPPNQNYYNSYYVNSLDGNILVPFDVKFFNTSDFDWDYGFVALKGAGLVPTLTNYTHIQNNVSYGPGDIEYTGVGMIIDPVSPPSSTQGVWSYRLFYRFPQTTGTPIYSSVIQITIPFFTMTYQPYTPNNLSYTFNITTQNPTTGVTIVQRGFAWSIDYQPSSTSNANRTMVLLSGTTGPVTYVFTNTPGNYNVGFWVLLSNGQRWWYNSGLSSIQFY